MTNEQKQDLIRRRRELLVSKILMAHSAACRQQFNQAVIMNSIGGLDILPSNREFDTLPIVVVAAEEGPRISDAQANVLISMTHAGYTKEDVVHAAYALGYQASHQKMKLLQQKIESLIADLSNILPAEEVEENDHD